MQASPNSHHNTGNAVDITVDPANGVHGDVLVELARKDPRAIEIIHDGRIWSERLQSLGWRPYGGQNPHKSHVHITVRAETRDNGGPWPWAPSKSCPLCGAALAALAVVALVVLAKTYA